VADWKDLAVVLSALLLVLGSVALAAAAQMFTIVGGKVIEKGVVTLELENGMSYSTPTISVLLENDDRVFRIEGGTVVEYAVTDSDAQLVEVGSQVKLLVSSYSNVTRLIAPEGSGHR
jgi:hypothetical protein